MRSRGIFARNSSEAIRDITDGTSNTFCAGERGFSSGSGIWAGVTDNAHPDDALTDTSHLSRPNGGWSSFSSRHAGGVHMLLCDGSVRFVTEKIESKPGPEMGIYQKLGCKNDGQVIGDY
jgi:prepilin-type processing-associated H-X9-DG protein